MSESPTLCSFAVQTVLCDGDQSAPTNLTLRGNNSYCMNYSRLVGIYIANIVYKFKLVPLAARLEIIAEYHQQGNWYSREDSLLMSIENIVHHNKVRLLINIKQHLSSFICVFCQDSFRVIDEIDGLTKNYTIMYNDSNDRTCAAVTIPASSCVNMTCTFMLILTQSRCAQSPFITAYTYATNLLGSGSHSAPLMIRMFRYHTTETLANTYLTSITATRNKVLKVRINASSIVCLLLMSNNFSSCYILYDHGENCEHLVETYKSMRNLSDIAYFDADIMSREGLCYLAVAVSDSTPVTVILRGTFLTGSGITCQHCIYNSLAR